MRTDVIRDTRGFSLLECLVAVGMLTTGLLSLAQLLAIAIGANASADRATHATLLASQKVEDLHAASWEWLEANAGSAAEALDAFGASADGATVSAAFTRQWTVEPLAADPANTYVIQVTVRTSRSEDTRLVSVRTRVSR